jgi:hypothetical protein
MHVAGGPEVFPDALHHSARVGIESERGTEAFAFLDVHTPTSHMSTLLKRDIPAAIEPDLSPKEWGCH